MKTVIVINGKPRSGKDTAVDLMRLALEDKGHTTAAFSSIEPIKMILGPYIDLGSKTQADRKLLATVGDALQEHSEWRTEASLRSINHFFYKTEDGVYFLHMREPRLIEMMKHKCEEKGIRFIRVLLSSNRSEDVTNNPADAGVEDGQYEDLLSNNSTVSDLEVTCRAFLSKYHLL